MNSIERAESNLKTSEQHLKEAQRQLLIAKESSKYPSIVSKLVDILQKYDGGVSVVDNPDNDMIKVRLLSTKLHSGDVSTPQIEKETGFRIRGAKISNGLLELWFYRPIY